ncbi:hypothetical protein CMV_029483 [Castanea mollissima]|uniref:Uncharacterized protein n=1 Tax=Castanea mollissima TaxID=60419 RepID=A0A8J4V0C8_9ROSI|nr:hypothetical protein CMV_029483 [Castanea mollissima]
MSTLSLHQWHKVPTSHHRPIPPKPLPVQMEVCSPRLSPKAKSVMNIKQNAWIAQDVAIVNEQLHAWTAQNVSTISGKLLIKSGQLFLGAAKVENENFVAIYLNY